MMVPEVCNILFLGGPSLLRYTLKHTSQCVPVHTWSCTEPWSTILSVYKEGWKFTFSFFFFYWQICFRQKSSFFPLTEKAKKKRQPRGIGLTSWQSAGSFNQAAVTKHTESARCILSTSGKNPARCMQVSAALTSSAEVDGSTYGSGTLQGAGAQALPHV